METYPVGSLFDAIIVGGGPAGLSAAPVLGRCMRRVLLFDDKRYRNAHSHALHCYMGLDGIAPVALHDLARAQLSRYDTVAIKGDRVHAVERQEPFIVHTAQGPVRARTILIASGVVDELPPVSGLPELFGTSVHVCPYCDAWEHRNAAVAVYGRSEKGVELALMLRLWTNDLILCTDGDVLTPKQQERLQARGVDWREERIHSVEGENGCLQAIRFLNGDAVARKALFFTTGQHPRSPLLEGVGCNYNDKGGVQCDPDGRTNIPGIYVAGDVSRDVQLAIIAAAEGARAALAINKHLLASA